MRAIKFYTKIENLLKKVSPGRSKKLSLNTLLTIEFLLKFHRKGLYIAFNAYYGPILGGVK